MIVYYIHYLLVSTFASFTVFRQKFETIVRPLIFWLLFLLAALRGEEVGRDHLVYIEYFEDATNPKSNYFTLSTILYHEPAVYFIPTFAKWLVGQQYFLYLTFGIFAFLGVWLRLKAIRITNSFFLTIVLYLTTYFLVHEMVQIRIGVASSLFLLSLPSLVNRKPVKFFLYIFGACLFHYSSLIFFFIYPLNVYKFSKKIHYALILFFSILSILKIKLLNMMTFIFISDKVEHYVKAAEEGIDADINIWTNFGFLSSLLFTLILIYKADIIAPRNKYFIPMLKIQVLSIIVYLIFSSVPIIAIRLSHAYGVVQLLLFPCVIYAFKEKLIGYAMVIGVSMMYFYNYYYRIAMFQPYYTWLSS